MKKVTGFAEYIDSVSDGKEMVLLLRDLLLQAGLTETIKWGQPVYTIDGKNVIGMGAFKSYTGLWFFHGALLKDPGKVLINPQEGVTRAQRQLRFNSIDEINPSLVLDYIIEAAANMKNGRVLKPEKNRKREISPELERALSGDSFLRKKFQLFTPFKQNEFHEYIISAKREETRHQRVNKCISLIKEGTGLNDKYRK